VPAAILSSNRGIDRSLAATDKDVSSGKYRLLYTAPEAVVEDHSWRMLLLAPRLSSTLVAIAVDKAHCVYIQMVSAVNFVYLANKQLCCFWCSLIMYLPSAGALTSVLPMLTLVSSEHLPLLELQCWLQQQR